jgi:hypothetical protein
VYTLGMKRETKSGIERDCASRKARRILGPKAGVWKAVKRQMNRRYRKAARFVEVD